MAPTAQPICLCYGTERFLLDQYVADRIGKLIPPDLRQLAVSRYDLKETPLDLVLDDAETAPFLTAHKVVVADHAFFFTGAKDTGKVGHDTERLRNYLVRPAAETLLIFIVEADKLDERKKIVKMMKDNRWIAHFPPLSPNELVRWLEDRARQHSVELAPGAAERLLMSVGYRLQSLAKELEKLSLYAGRGGTVTAETIAELVEPDAEQNVFLLVEEIVNGRLDQALRILERLLKQREEPIKIVALLARQFRLILQVNHLRQTGLSDRQIAGRLGVHPYPVKLAAEQGRTYDEAQLVRLLGRLADLDYAMKSGQIDKIAGLELALLEIGAVRPAGIRA